MRNWRLFCVVIISGLLVACSTPPVAPSKEYLLLDKGQVEAEPIATKSVAMHLLPVSVAPYLLGTELVLVSSQGEVFRSQNNLWAEPLSTQLTRISQQSLEHSLPDITWFGHQSVPVDGVYQLNLEVDAFYADLEGNVHITGRWQLVSPARELLQVDTFTIVEPLQADGFPAMVNTLSHLWLEKVLMKIAQQIPQALNAS